MRATRNGKITKVPIREYVSETRLAQWLSAVSCTPIHTLRPFSRIGNGHGAALHWPDLDEYVSVRSILLGRRSAEGSDRDDRPVQE